MDFFKNFQIYGNKSKHNRHFIIHSGPTNSGKTHDGIVAISKSTEKCIYAAPLRLLALEVYERFNREGIVCDLITGEEKVKNEDSRVVSCTIEALNYEQVYDVAVIDECHMIKDDDRGMAWTNAMLNVIAKTIHVCCDQSAVPLLQAMIYEMWDTSEVVEHQRNTPLIVDSAKFVYPDSVQPGDALIAFSRRAVLALAADLKQKGIATSVIYGKLPPRVRREQYKLFNEGKTKVVVATDAIGMGLNMPIKRVVFMEDMKFDGTSMEPLSDFEIKQVAGRAGRFGIFDEGLVNIYPGGCYMNKKALSTSITRVLPPIKCAKLGVPEHMYNKCKNYEQVLALHADWNLIKIENVLYEKEKTITKNLIIEAYVKILHKFNFCGGQINQLFKTNFNLEDDRELVQNLLLAYCQKHKLSKPVKHNGTLEGMEKYSHQLDVFYSFANNFLCELDEEWIASEKEETSKSIMKFLMKKCARLGKKCDRCGKALPWNFVHKHCDACHFA